MVHTRYSVSYNQTHKVLSRAAKALEYHAPVTTDRHEDLSFTALHRSMANSSQHHLAVNLAVGEEAAERYFSQVQRAPIGEQVHIKILMIIGLNHTPKPFSPSILFRFWTT